MRSLRSILLVLLAALLVFAAARAAHSQPDRNRIILKDGSYQVITKYEIKGDRVRYFSAERDDWEEVPTELVDWAATEKWNREHSPGSKPSKNSEPSDPDQAEAAKLDAEEAAARHDEFARMPVIAPGLHLPDETGVWILDTYDGQPELVHALQANGDLNRASDHSVLRAAIGASPGARELIHINNAYSRLQLHVDTPVLYVSLDSPSGTDETAPESALTVDTHGASSVRDKNSHSSPDSNYAIIRLTGIHNLRTASAAEVYRIAQAGHSEDIIETSKELLPGARWMKLTPKQPLLIGEYALIEILSAHEVNLDVWDFGVNPRAKENKDARAPIDEP